MFVAGKRGAFIILNGAPQRDFIYSVLQFAAVCFEKPRVCFIARLARGDGCLETFLPFFSQ